MSKALHNIKTNVITGFLGVGKTTAILSWLKNKPQNERWSVLVNEAGQVGVDGKVMEDAGIAVKQVPGGCMCCAAGLPMQVAVNQLLIATRPHRLLIEPSGMGHPRNILKTLSSKEYEGVLDLRACLCLIDPRHLSDQHYLDSELFMDQIAVADVLVANKTDQCTTADQTRFDEFSRSLNSNIQASGWVSQGRLEPEWMQLKHATERKTIYKSIINNKTEWVNISMQLPDDVVLDMNKLQQFIDELKVERLKAIINTTEGVVFINHVTGETSVSPVNASNNYHMEIVSSHTIDENKIKDKLLLCQV